MTVVDYGGGGNVGGGDEGINCDMTVVDGGGGDADGGDEGIKHLDVTTRFRNISPNQNAVAALTM